MSDAKPRRTIRESVRNEGPEEISSGVSAASAAPGIAAPTAAEASPEPAPPAAPAALIEGAAPAALIEGAAPAALIEPAAPAADDPYIAIAEMQAALARGFEQAAVALTAVVGSGIAAAADAGIALLGARTLAEAVEINAGLVRRRTNALIDGSTRLSEIAATAASEASQAMLGPLGKLWSGGVLG